MTVAELIKRLQEPDISPDWIITVVDDPMRSDVVRVDIDYRGSSEMVVELWVDG